MQDTDDLNTSAETLKNIQEPNEFISVFRAMVAEENQMSAGEMFPLTDDSAGDIILNFLGVWMGMRSILPVESREQVAAAMDDMAQMLEKMQREIPDDPEHRRQFMMRSLRTGIAPYFGRNLG